MNQAQRVLLGLGAAVAAAYYLLSTEDIMGTATAGFKSDFVKRIWADANQVANEIGWPRDLLVTQAAHESNWGRSALATKYNNLFGIKEGGWVKAGKLVTPPMPTWEEENGRPVQIQAQFRAYATWADSMRDWAAFLNRPRYAKAVTAAVNGDAKGFFAGLQEGGYATDSQYSNKLAAVYNAVRGVVV